MDRFRRDEALAVTCTTHDLNTNPYGVPKMCCEVEGLGSLRPVFCEGTVY